MTAPGQEPDEVLTATPEGKGPRAEEPDLGAIGDNLMPEDLREAVRAENGPDTGSRAISETSTASGTLGETEGVSEVERDVEPAEDTGSDTGSDTRSASDDGEED